MREPDERTLEQVLEDVEEEKKRQLLRQEGGRPRVVNLEMVHKRLIKILEREAEWLAVESKKGKLGKDESQSLTNYLKLMKELKKEAEQYAENLSTEELVKIATGNKTTSA